MIDIDRQPTPPGEWETDEYGRRFRYDGRCIEYEPIITTSHGTVTMKQLASMNAREKGKAVTPPAFEPTKYCPFKTGVSTRCTKDDCAWFTEGKCAQSCPHPATGKKCPHNNTACKNDCALQSE